MRLNLIHQAKAFLLSNTAERRRGRRVLVDRLSSATLFSSVNTVLEAFRRAREKMVRATDGLEPKDGRNIV